ncbi:uncharacterized protein LOC129760674 [Uranotaenia lowii]|uniref:uncharacterized protein LOC129760674 n=1 Tax=Uranotaenia lowii TaxID=190385 RepID=UPI00247B2C0E|nr:uncharacterized protein LOC129760674 [Uranotaenia lowii]
MESISAEARGEIYEKLWSSRALSHQFGSPNPASKGAAGGGGARGGAGAGGGGQQGSLTSFRIDEFVNVIKQFPIIYNRIDKHNKQEYSETWDQLEAILKTPKKFLMMKWKGLRDNFRVELKKEFFSPPENRYVSKWVHYKKLAFLKEQVLQTLDQKLDNDSHDELQQIMQFVQNATQEHNATSRGNEHSYANGELDPRELGSVKVEQQDDESREASEDYSFSHFQDPEDTHRLPEITITPKIVVEPASNVGQQQHPINLQRKRRSESVQMEIPVAPPKYHHSESLSPSKMEPFGAVPQDDDYHFLMSIYPYLKQLTLPVKLKVRLQIQQVLFNELMKETIEDEDD